MRSGAFRRAMSYIIDDFVLSMFELIYVLFNQSKINEEVLLLVKNIDDSTIIDFYINLFKSLGQIMWAGIGVLFIIGLLYMIVLPLYWDGRTVGRKIVGVRVVSTISEDLSVYQLVVRELIFKVLWWGITLGIGVIVDWIMIVVREDKCTLRDLVARTCVELDDGEYVKESYNEF